MGRSVYPRRSEGPLRSSPRPNKNENNTVWPHFMRWVQWPSKTMPFFFYWYPSWAACSQTLLSPQFTQGLNVDKARHRATLQTQQATTALIPWKGGKKDECAIHAPKLSERTCQLTLIDLYSMLIRGHVQLVPLIHASCVGMQNFSIMYLWKSNKSPKNTWRQTKSNKFN